MSRSARTRAVTPLVSTEQARRLVSDPPLGLHYARFLVRSGEWQSIRIGRRILVHTASVLAWVERQASQ